MDLAEVMRTTGAVRSYTSQPVADDVVYRILDNARFASNGNNRQGWRVVVIRDPTIRMRLRDLYLKSLAEGLAQMETGRRAFGLDEKGRSVAPPPARPAQELADVLSRHEEESVVQFARRLPDAPVLLLIAVDMRQLAVVDSAQPRVSIVGGASIYTFAQNVLLAARNEDLGGVLTTALCAEEPAVRDLLAIPEGFAVACLIALGHPHKQITRLSRKPVEEFASIDRLDGPPLKPGPST